MKNRKQIIGICGSASRNSGNLAILKHIATSEDSAIELEIIDDLSAFPHFRTDQTDDNTPQKITNIRDKIARSNGVIICTPEYVFSIPSGLKNLLEWCVSTTVFSDKPVGLITASAQGEKGHAELQLIMKTIQAVFNEDTTLLIQGIKSKVSRDGNISASNTTKAIDKLMQSFKQLINSAAPLG